MAFEQRADEVRAAVDGQRAGAQVDRADDSIARAPSWG
jgi:hypothetical protein